MIGFSILSVFINTEFGHLKILLEDPQFSLIQNSGILKFSRCFKLLDCIIINDKNEININRNTCVPKQHMAWKT